MVLYVCRWNIQPGKEEPYSKWTPAAIQRMCQVPGVVEFRAYRTAAGESQVVITFEFASMAAWADWHGHEDVQEVLTELYTLASNVKLDLWGPSPSVPVPIRPGQCEA